MPRILFLTTLLLIHALYLGPVEALAKPDEGMFPPTAIQREALRKAGLRLDPERILSLSDSGILPALVRVGGCSGAFVSAQGLLMTNHHCAFDAVATASTPEKNHLQNGFYAQELKDEIPAKGLSLRITVGFEDCSPAILADLPGPEQPLERQKAIREKMSRLEKDAYAQDSSLVYEVAEMFPGKSYLLFRYRILRDLRLVYVPSRAIGEFGGESDNWVWPRHTGDYTFLRAYTGPRGENRGYHPDNIPVVPTAFLPIASQPLKEEDFVMVMGYPGRTFRHYPTSYLRYQQQKLLPITQHNFEWLIQTLEDQSRISTAEALLWSSRIKSLGNTAKNYRGKIQGLQRTPILEQFKAKDLLAKSLANSQQRSQLDQLDSLYGLMAQHADLHLNMGPMQSQSRTLQWLIKNAESRQKRANHTNRSSLDSLIKAEDLALEAWTKANKATWRPALEVKVLAYFVAKHPDLRPTSSAKAWDSWLQRLQKSGDFPAYKGQNAEIGTYWWSLTQRIKKDQADWNARINTLLPTFMDLRLQASGQDGFVPDANGTLRLTYGRVQGYRPDDAVYHEPFTHLSGLFQKAASGHPDYALDSALWRATRRTGVNSQPLSENRFGDLGLQAVAAEADQTRTKVAMESPSAIPVAFLYNLDTTGGNSGSPVMNADGELVGLNFDRAFGATINDFAWNKDYSRSIGVDIRFVLWNLRHVVPGHRLLDELLPQNQAKPGVQPSDPPRQR